MLLMLNDPNFGLVDLPLMAVYVFCRLAFTLSMNWNFKKSPFFQPNVASKELKLRSWYGVQAADGLMLLLTCPGFTVDMARATCHHASCAE